MRTQKHTSFIGNLSKIVKTPTIFLFFGMMGLTFLAEAQGSSGPGQGKPNCTDAVCYCGMRCYLGAAHVKRQLEYDRLHEWVNKMRGPLRGNGGINTQRNAVEYLKYSWKFVDLGFTGNDIAMEKALFDFQMGANNCMRVVRESMSRTNVVPVVDYREYFVCLGRAAAIGDLINQFEQFRMARSFAAKRIQIVNRDMASSLRNRKPGNIANEHLKKWAGEGYQELMNYWNGQ